VDIGLYELSKTADFIRNSSNIQVTIFVVDISKEDDL